MVAGWGATETHSVSRFVSIGVPRIESLFFSSDIQLFQSCQQQSVTAGCIQNLITMLNSVLVGKKESKIHVLETREVLSCAVTEVLGSFMALSVGEKVAESQTSREYMLMLEHLPTGFEKLLEIQ